VLPEWISNVHLLVAHAPLVLLVAAVLVDLLSLSWKRWDGGLHAATGLWVLAGIMAVVAYVTGTSAVATVAVPDGTIATTLAEHQTWSWYTMLYTGIYALLRLGITLVADVLSQTVVHTVVVLIGACGLWPMGQAAGNGLQMVHRHGVSVAMVEKQRATTDTTAQAGAVPDSALGLTMRDTGWTWIPSSPGGWKDRVEWLRGDPTQVRAYLFEPEGTGQRGLALRLQDTRIFVTIPREFGDVEVGVALNLDEFDGTARVAHHVRGQNYYDFLGIDDDRLLLGRLEGQQLRTYDTRTYAVDGWRRIRIVGSGTTRRAFIEDRMVVDGDGTVAGDGAVGLYLNGTGTVRLREMSATAASDDGGTS
jgi:hypothetical protein